jgi:Na+/proline symporter
MKGLFLKNEGTVDRVVRVVLGLALLLLVFVGPRSAWGLVGLVPLFTGAIGSCPLYRLIGLCTRSHA